MFRFHGGKAALMAGAGAWAAVGFAVSCGGAHGTNGVGASGGSGASGSSSKGGAAGNGDFVTSGGWVEPPPCDAGMADAKGGMGGRDGSTGAAGNGMVGSGGDATGCDGVVGEAHFQKDVGPILAGCTGELCHLTPGYADLVGKPATECCDGRLLVSPFDPAHSYLVDKVHGTHLCYGGQMPFGTTPLGDADVQTLVKWICEGAPDD